MEYIKLTLIITFCFLLRLIFVITESSDVSVHLWHIKKSKIFGFGNHTAFNSVFNGKKAYQSFPHYIISLFPEHTQIKLGYCLNIVYDCISIFIIYLLAKMIFSTNIVPINKQYYEPHLITTLLFGTSPILFPYTARLKSFGGRTFGNLMNIIYFSSLGICILSNNYYYLIVTVCSGILILLSSAFGMQVMVFFSIILSIIYFNAIPILALALTFLLGASFPFLGVRDIIKFKLNHYIWYTKNYQKGTGASDRNRMVDFVLYPIYAFSQPKKFFQLTFKKLTPIIATYSLPTLVILVIWFAQDYHWFIDFSNSEIIKYLLVISLSSLIVFILVSFKWFSFLGEAERYFEYSTAAIILLFVIFCYQYSYYNLLFYMVLLHLSIIMITFLASVQKMVRKAVKIEADYHFDELLEFLKTLEDGRILSIPTKLNFGLSVHNNNLKFYYQFITENKIDGFKRQQQDEIIYNFVKPDFVYFNKNYKIDTFVVEKSALKKSRKKYDIEYDFSNMELVFENDEYFVFQYS
jgi:hypothetical protein